MKINNKIILISLIASTQLALLGEGISEDRGTISGLVRLGYVNQNNEASTDTYVTALGGILKYETPVWNDLKLGGASYVSMKFPFASGSGENLNLDFFDSDGDSFVYVGEAYADYTANDLNVRIGRQLIDTPFANADEIRLLPNTFEAAMATYKGIENTLFTVGYIQRWAGYDSGDDISKFKKLSEGSSGAAIFGVMNQSIDNLALQGWFYSIDKMTDIFYGDAVYEYPFSDSVGLELKGEMAHLSEATDESGMLSGIDGNVYGIGASLDMGMWTFGFAHNFSSNEDGKSLGSILSGGPYYTSMEEWGIDGMEDARAYVGTIEVDLADAGVEGVALTCAYGVFRSTPMDAKITEMDMIAVYQISERISTDVSYAKIEDKNKNFDAGNDAGYSRFLARLNYTF